MIKLLLGDALTELKTLPRPTRFIYRIRRNRMEEKLITFRVSMDQYKRLREYCFFNDITIRKFFTENLDEKLTESITPAEKNFIIKEKAKEESGHRI